ncbi:hypothetical protein SAMN04488137_2444 [Fictibacillus solisalsi]|uniref:Cytosolic protein n=1 Tax=Fictibacillus solisalsi TaxID=459525 RepID=A0A1G9WXJ3_9BACL|nr:hypothetical protein [Fictibacillus solisalsi]SDM89149.1 hypothetical protein SAMN04488137_2444 [Fictibacillus solisalsi]
MLRRLQNVLKNNSETSENHYDPLLRTPYFKANRTSVMDALEDLVRQKQNYKLLGSSRERGEFSFQVTSPRKAFVVVTATTLRPYRTAIDFNVSTESALPVDFGYSKKVIANVTEELKGKLEYIGTSLMENN